MGELTRNRETYTYIHNFFYKGKSKTELIEQCCKETVLARKETKVKTSSGEEILYLSATQLKLCRKMVINEGCKALRCAVNTLWHCQPVEPSQSSAKCSCISGTKATKVCTVHLWLVFVILLSQGWYRGEFIFVKIKFLKALANMLIIADSAAQICDAIFML